ncbi:F-box only protein 48-like [Eptesicus fuscus]|uniref:F-box only protein 48-like n=1 Tax=Eptesicus fuscus TaxID=29078 RepID=UPI002403AC9C|nr:F-box only protein 48-like [Eptesicus fuscus]XP_054584263.1 F-box only protein 48-like [Eptesicus fuscus]
MQNNSKRNHNSKVSDIDLNSVDTEKENNELNKLITLPQEIALHIFSQLDVQSLCRASMTCRRWNDTIRNHDFLWKPHCLAIRAVCAREVDDDRKSGYSWRDTLLRNYKKSQVKHGWLSGRFSNIDLPTLLSETTMCPMDAETWGEILEAELNGSEIKNDGRISGSYTPRTKLE